MLTIPMLITMKTMTMLTMMMTVFLKMTIVMVMLLIVILKMTMMTMMTMTCPAHFAMSYNLLCFSTPHPHKGTYGAASQQDHYHLSKVIEIQPQNHQRHPNEVKQPPMAIVKGEHDTRKKLPSLCWFKLVSRCISSTFPSLLQVPP